MIYYKRLLKYTCFCLSLICINALHSSEALLLRGIRNYDINAIRRALNQGAKITSSAIQEFLAIINQFGRTRDHPTGRMTLADIQATYFYIMRDIFIQHVQHFGKQSQYIKAPLWEEFLDRLDLSQNLPPEEPLIYETTHHDFAQRPCSPTYQEPCEESHHTQNIYTAVLEQFSQQYCISRSCTPSYAYACAYYEPTTVNELTYPSWLFRDSHNRTALLVK